VNDRSVTETTLAQEIGKKLRECREASRLKQREVAERMPVARETYAMWELGKNLIPTAELRRAAEVLDTSVNYLLGLESLATARAGLIERYLNRLPPKVQEMKVTELKTLGDIYLNDQLEDDADVRGKKAE
jgi:transcriptional regulator with XRE-family HTH domain